MDTRSKILTPEAARSLPGPHAVVTGYFDVLRAEHARELASIRLRSGAQTLVALVLPFPGEVFESRARARMIAALRVVDYVVVASEQEAQALIEALRPQLVTHLEDGDVRRNREIAAVIRSRHGQAAP